MTTDLAFQKLLQTLYKPAQRALHSEGIKSVDGLYALGRSQLLDIHGIGPETIDRIEAFTGRKLND